MYDEYLIKRLNAEPKLDKVYFNKEGGWLFVPNTFHTTIKTREEVLEAHEKSNTPADDNTEEEGTLGGIVKEIVDTIIPPVDAEGKSTKKR